MREGNWVSWNYFEIYSEKNKGFVAVKFLLLLVLHYINTDVFIIIAGKYSLPIVIIVSINKYTWPTWICGLLMINIFYSSINMLSKYYLLKMLNKRFPHFYLQPNNLKSHLNEWWRFGRFETETAPNCK